MTLSRQWRSQQRNEGGRGGIADCHRCWRRMRWRRKANAGAQAAGMKTTATVEENESKMIASINAGGTNDGTEDRV